MTTILKCTFFVFIVFMLSSSYCFAKMKGLSNKQLQNFVSNESICYEKLVQECEESDKPEAIRETSQVKEKDQLETLEDSYENLMDIQDTPPSAVTFESSDVNRPPAVVFINTDTNGQYNTRTFIPPVSVSK